MKAKRLRSGASRRWLLLPSTRARVTLDLRVLHCGSSHRMHHICEAEGEVQKANEEHLETDSSLGGLRLSRRAHQAKAGTPEPDFFGTKFLHFDRQCRLLRPNDLLRRY